MKTLEEYRDLIGRYFREKAVNYGVKRMGIFGSVARNEQKDDSDIDIIYEGEANILTRSRMKFELESLLGCEVDIVRKRSENDEKDRAFMQQIKNDICYV